MSTLHFTAADPRRVLSILSSLSGPLQAERRDSTRTPFQARLLATPLTHPYARSVPLLARNLSSQGLGVLSRIPLVAGDSFAIPISITPDNSKLLRCRIIYSRTLKGGMYDVGLHFEEAISGPVGLTNIPAHWLDSHP